LLAGREEILAAKWTTHKGQPARPTMARDHLLSVGDDIAALRSHASTGM